MLSDKPLHEHWAILVLSIELLTIPRKVRQLESTRSSFRDILALVVREIRYIGRISEQQCVETLYTFSWFIMGVWAGQCLFRPLGILSQARRTYRIGLSIKQVSERAIKSLLVWSQDLRHLRSLRECPGRTLKPSDRVPKTPLKIGFDTSVERLQFVEEFLCQWFHQSVSFPCVLHSISRLAAFCATGFVH